MSELFLNNLVIVYLFSEVLIALLSIYLLFINIRLLLFWDFEAFTPLQNSLEKKAYLASVLGVFLFTFELILLVYFVYMIDSLSIIVPGAMCAAGVISANSYGMALLFVKLTTLFTLLLFLVANNIDLKAKNYPLFKFKFFVLLLAIILIFTQSALDFLYFFNIDLSKPVSCCSALFGNLEGANPLPFGLDIKTLIALFYLMAIASVISLLLESRFGVIFSLILFGLFSYYAVVYFFGTYIYELPTHKCPFCMMQKEYYYIGYFLWGSLFFGLFFGLIWAIMAFVDRSYKNLRVVSIILLIIFVGIVSFYPIFYYLKNGVFL